jgi:glycosyltransferase involved in cell wall biosynthesis
MPLNGRRILYLVSEDWYFCSHRLPIARAARNAGAEILVATSVANHGSAIEGEGFRLLPVKIERSGLNALADLSTLWSLIRLYRHERPDIVHHVALKPVLYGSLAAWIAGVPIVINALAGLGFLFISDGNLASLLRPVVRFAFRILFNRKNSRLILQNSDDVLLFLDHIGIQASRIDMIRGSGVDIIRYQPTPEPDVSSEHPVVALCVTRMLWDKGIGELVAAARLLKTRGVAITVRLVGPSDRNPAAIDVATLDGWRREGIVDVAGPSEDIPDEYARAHIAVLPSYREGLPKSLLEAAAAGRPIVSSDVPGCREICREGQTGFLVPAHSIELLAEKLAVLASDAELRHKMGAAARKAVEEEFSEAAVIEQTLALYDDALSKNVPT